MTAAPGLVLGEGDHSVNIEMLVSTSQVIQKCHSGTGSPQGVHYGVRLIISPSCVAPSYIPNPHFPSGISCWLVRPSLHGEDAYAGILDEWLVFTFVQCQIHT